MMMGKIGSFAKMERLCTDFCTSNDRFVDLFVRGLLTIQGDIEDKVFSI